MLKTYLVLFFLLYFQVSHASQKVKHVEVNGDQIVTVKTSLGIATIIQVPDRPNSVVVGDQDSFKVEYLDQAITIKPLVPGARSNLYVYTDWHRFNVELVSGPQSLADYVVYLKLKPKKEKQKSAIKWRKFNNHLNNGNFRLRVKKIGTVENGMGLVEFEIISSKEEQLNPEWIWLSQDGEIKPIHNLVLSGLVAGPKKVITGLMQLNLSEFAKDAVKIEMRRKKTSFLTLPRIDSWK